MRVSLFTLCLSAAVQHLAAGFNADLEKYLEAGLLGWRVFRFGPEQITMENVGRLACEVTFRSA